MRERSLFCSAFVTHVFRRVAVDLAPGLNDKHTTPEDISRTPVPHETFLLRCEIAAQPVRQKIQQLCRAVKEGHKKRIEKIKTLAAKRTGRSA